MDLLAHLRGEEETEFNESFNPRDMVVRHTMIPPTEVFDMNYFSPFLSLFTSHSQFTPPLACFSL